MGRPAAEVVRASYTISVECYTLWLTNSRGKIMDQPSALFGVAADPMNNRRGIMWMVSTEEIRRAPISILREAIHWVEHFNRLYPDGLENFVDLRNGLHLRWLRLLGFSEQETVMIHGHPFTLVQRGCHV